MIDSFSGLGKHAIDIGDLVSSPLIAASQANSSMAQHQLDFLMNFCFEEDPKTGKKSAKTIKMIMTKASHNTNNSNGDNLQSSSLTFELPIITLLSFSALSVKKIKAKFDIEILTTSKYSEEKSGRKKHQSLKGNIGYSPNKNTNTNENRKSTSINVEVDGGEIPLPQGLKLLLNIYSKNITPSKQ